MTQRSSQDKFWRLVEETLGASTVYDIIRILKLKGVSDEEIKAELNRRHGLNELQASQALMEYRKIHKEEY